MDEVAREAEYSKRTVYIYFNSKEQIYFEIMIRGYRLLIEMLEEALRDSQDAVEELRRIFFTFFRFSVENKDYFKAIMEYETREPKEESGIENVAKDECYRLGEQLFGILVRTLRRGVAEGSLRGGLEAEKTALALWACTIGVFITGEKKSQYLAEYHQTKPDAFVSDAFELMIRSILAEGSAL